MLSFELALMAVYFLPSRVSAMAPEKQALGCPDKDFHLYPNSDGKYICRKTEITEKCAGHYVTKDGTDQWECCPTGEIWYSLKAGDSRIGKCCPPSQPLALDERQKKGDCCRPGYTYTFSPEINAGGCCDTKNQFHYSFDVANKRGSCCPRPRKYHWSSKLGRGKCCHDGYSYSEDEKTKTAECCPIKTHHWDGSACVGPHDKNGAVKDVADFIQKCINVNNVNVNKGPEHPKSTDQ